MGADGDGGIRGIAARVRAGREPESQGKANRMYVAAEPQYSVLQAYCREKKFKVNQVLDDLVRVFLLELRDDPQLQKIAEKWSYSLGADDVDGAA